MRTKGTAPPAAGNFHDTPAGPIPAANAENKWALVKFNENLIK